MEKEMVGFNNILDDDEIIIETFKPNKQKFYFQGFVAHGIFWFFMFIVLILIRLFPDDDGQMPMAVIYVAIGIFVLFTLLISIFIKMSYKKRVYAYTNKRIVIQGGIIGVDYKSLDHKMIGANEVRVDLFDKLIKKNTGTIKFGSQASPMNQQGISMFIFNSIEDPYNVYKRIKKYIDEVKSN